MNQTLARRVVAEAIGTSFLLAAVVGSGIMAERLASGNIALALLTASLCLAAGLLGAFFLKPDWVQSEWDITVPHQQ